NVCTTDRCNGTVSSPLCVHAAGNASTVCRAVAGECDVAETCSGTSTTCPADGKKTSGTACADDGIVCTSDLCNGSSALCQHAVGNAGTVCRAAVDSCDAAETCTGASVDCPADQFKASGASCPDDGNPCTTDLCNGTSSACQHPAGN